LVPVRGIVMKSHGSTSATITRKISSAMLEIRYLDLQRLRDEVRKAEARCAPKKPQNKNQIYSALIKSVQPSARL
jgi:hypothetical protein